MAGIVIEVIYARPDVQRSERLTLAEGTSARAVLNQTRIPEEFPEIDIAACPLGIWGKQVEDDYVLRDGDRLEIYRPLLNDPRETRRRLAAEGKTMGKPLAD